MERELPGGTCSIRDLPEVPRITAPLPWAVIAVWTHPFPLCYLTRSCNARSPDCCTFGRHQARAASTKAAFL